MIGFNFSKTFYRVATVPAFLISAMLTYLLVEYSIHGAKALESDTEMKALAAAVAVVLAISQLAGSTYASLLADQNLTLRCFGLRTLAYFICAVEFFTGVGMQLSTALGADMVQTQVSTREESLKTRIQRYEEMAREKREGALRQERLAKNAYELHLASRQRQSATADASKAEALQDQLKSLQSEKAPTFVGSVGQAGGILGFDFDAGKAFAVMLIVSRMLGLCAGALLFSEVAGALLNRGWPGFRAPASALPAPEKRPAPLPAEPFTRPLRAHPQAGRAMVDPVAPAAPEPAPAPAAPAPVAPAQVQKVQVQEPKVQSVPTVSLEKPAKSASAQVQRVQPKDGDVPDGVREAIKSGAIRPSQGGIKSLGHGQNKAEIWLAKLGAEGLIEWNPDSKRWKLKGVQAS